MAPGLVSYDEATRTVRFAPSAPLAPSTTYTVTPAATDASGAGLAEGSSWTFTTRAEDRPEGECPCSLFPESRVPTIASDADSALVTLGVSFTPAVDGPVTAVQFYKGAGNTGAPPLGKASVRERM